MKALLVIAVVLGLGMSTAAYAYSDWLQITGGITINNGTITKVTDSKSKVDCYVYREQYINSINNSLSCVKQ